MTFTSALPANLLKFSLPLARFIYVVDSASTTEIAVRADAVLQLTDSSIGIENRLSPVPLSVSDSSLGLEAITDRLVELLDSASGIEAIIRELLREDSASGIDQSLPLAIAISLSDSASGIDEAFLTLVEFLLTDSSIGIENRLSPVPLSVSDSSLGLDLITRKDMRFISDASSGFEESLLELVAMDVAIVLEALTPDRSLEDSSIGLENRLSPVPLSVSDSSSGIEQAILFLREVITSDTASGLDLLAVKNMRIPADTAIGAEVTLFERLLKDDAVVSEIVSFLSRLFTDSSSGIENRLSPVPLSASDSSSGLENAFFTLFETVLTDSTVASDTIRSKKMLHADIATTLEQAVISLHRVQLGVAVDSIIHRLLSKTDSSIGLENRLSPVPLSVSDSSSGLETVTDRLLELIEEAVTEERSVIRIFTPPFPQLINSTIMSSSFYAGVESRILMDMIGSSIVYTAIAILYRFRVLLQQLSIHNMLDTDPNTSVFRIFYAYINSQHTMTSYPIQSILRIVIQSMYTQTLSTLVQTIGYDVTTYLSSSLIYSLRTDPTVRIRKRYTQRITTDMHTDTQILYFTQVLLTTIDKIYTDTLLQVSSTITAVRSIINSVYLTLPTTIVFSTGVITGSIVESIQYALSTLEYLSSFVEKELLESVARSFITLTWSVHLPAVSLTDVFAYNRHQEVFGISYQSRLLTDVFIHLLGWAVHIGAFYRELTDGFFYGTLLKVRETTTAFKYLKQLQDLIRNNFRYVRTGDPVLPIDHNILVNALQLFITFAQVLTDEIFIDDIAVRNKLNELRSAYEKLRHVKSFDIIVSRDHNRLIDTIIKAREFLRLLYDKVTAS